MTTIRLGGKEFVLVIDTGSSDTWVASTNFQCEHRLTRMRIPLSRCNIGALYEESSPSLIPLPGRNFSVAYTDGEFLSGMLASETVEVGGLRARQAIGVVEKGWWIGDGRSSGLMGLAYPLLVDGGRTREGNYSSIVFSL